MYLEKNKIFKHIDFIIIDVLCMEASFILSYFIRHGNGALFDDSAYRASMVFLAIASIVSDYLLDTMKDVLKRNKQFEFYSTIKQAILTTILLVLFLFLTKTSENISRNVIIIFLLLYIVFSYFIRLLSKIFIERFVKNKKKTELIIATTYENVKSLIDSIENTINDYQISGVIIIDKESHDEFRDKFDDKVSVVAYKDNYVETLKKIYVDEVLLVPCGVDASELIKSINKMGIVLHLELAEINDTLELKNNLVVNEIAGKYVITSVIKTISFIQLIIKRIIDIVFGIVGSIFTLLFTIIIGPIIIMKSKGPIFFTQDRVGRNGKVFKMIKFRSMYLGAEKDKKSLASRNENYDALMFKMTDDPRVIKGIGEFIRKTSIDEFPQFINVLKGDMSVVGTRPPTLDEWDKYDLGHRARLVIKPGITGLWQVSGRSDIKNFEDVVRLDTKYIKTFSLWQDFFIILKTIKVVLAREGAR